MFEQLGPETPETASTLRVRALEQAIHGRSVWDGNEGRPVGELYDCRGDSHGSDIAVDDGAAELYEGRNEVERQRRRDREPRQRGNEDDVDLLSVPTLQS